MVKKNNELSPGDIAGIRRLYSGRDILLPRVKQLEKELSAATTLLRRAIKKDARPIHEHSATCNHKVAPRGAVYAAVMRDDLAALLTALGDGASTEESDEVITS